MIGNGPIIEIHIGAAECSVLGHPAPHSGPPHFERTCRQFGAHDFDHAGLVHARSFKDGLKGGSVFPSHLNDCRDISRAQTDSRFIRFGHAFLDSVFNVGRTKDIIKSTCEGMLLTVKISL